MITPEKMSQLEQNKVVEMFTKLNQDLTSDIIKRIQKTGDISSFTRSQIKVLIRQGGKDMFYSALKRINGLSRAQKKAIEQLYQEILIAEYDGYKSQYTKIGKDFEISKTSYMVRFMGMTEEEAKQELARINEEDSLSSLDLTNEDEGN